MLCFIKVRPLTNDSVSVSCFWLIFYTKVLDPLFPGGIPADADFICYQEE